MGGHALANLIGGLQVFDHHCAVSEVFAIVQQPVHVRQHRIAGPQTTQGAGTDPRRYGLFQEDAEIIALLHLVRVRQIQLFEDLGVGLFLQRLLCSLTGSCGDLGGLCLLLCRNTGAAAGPEIIPPHDRRAFLRDGER